MARMTHRPQQNRLLAALPAAELGQLAARMELVPLALGDMLYEPDGQLEHGYFPTTSIVSLQYVMASGASAESAAANLETMTSAVLLASLEPEQLSRSDRERFEVAMEELSARAFESYRALVYETEGFQTFFRQIQFRQDQRFFPTASPLFSQFAQESQGVRRQWPTV